MKGWACVFTSGTDYEAEMVCARLQAADIPAVVLSQRDHAWNLTQGFLAKVRVMVPESVQSEAEALLNAATLPDEELTRAALGGNAKG